MGKKNVINNFCISVQSNWSGCTSCHVGYGWVDDDFDFGNPEKVDCLVCHDQSGQYAKSSGGYPGPEVDLAAAAQSVATPTRDNCGGCHFRGGGGDAVYMYTTYERVWHWLQALAIMMLLFTGIEIHATSLGLMDFALAVRVHNILGFVVLANAVFAAFYHLASGEIKQYLPEPRGFFGQAFIQASFYLSGIFKGESHPFEKSPAQKLNPLQQITYLGILNVLLPLQIITGVLIWGVQRWPAVDGYLGGLTFLAPLHALGAWLFAAFLLIHVYLTTTGPTPTANIRAMVVGWEATEAPEGSSEAL